MSEFERKLPLYKTAKTLRGEYISIVGSFLVKPKDGPTETVVKTPDGKVYFLWELTDFCL